MSDETFAWQNIGSLTFEQWLGIYTTFYKPTGCFLFTPQHHYPYNLEQLREMYDIAKSKECTQK